jgi:hypothetical protein
LRPPVITLGYNYGIAQNVGRMSRYSGEHRLCTDHFQQSGYRHLPGQRRDAPGFESIGNFDENFFIDFVIPNAWPGIGGATFHSV